MLITLQCRGGTLLVFGTLYYQSFAKKDSKHGHKENGAKHGVGAAAAPEKAAEGDVEAVKPLLEGLKEEVKQ